MPLPIIREKVRSFETVEFGPLFLGSVDLVSSLKRSQPNVEDEKNMPSLALLQTVFSFLFCFASITPFLTYHWG